MAAPDAKGERAALRRSIMVTGILGIVGVVWGIASGSQMILLDGVYGFVGVVVSALSLRASALAQAPPSRRFQYGREAVTPLVIGIQGLVLLATLSYAAFEAVYVIRAGGSDLTAGWAVAYGAVATVGALGTWRWLQRSAGTSDLLIAEATAWRVSTLTGVGMVVGFSILAAMQRAGWDAIAPYVDPVMVLVTCVAFCPAPIQMTRRTVLELLEVAPSKEIQREVAAVVAEVRAMFELADPDVRTTKVGPKLYVDVIGEVAPEVTVTHEQKVRSALETRLDSLPYDIWLHLELRPAPG